MHHARRNIKTRKPREKFVSSTTVSTKQTHEPPARSLLALFITSTVYLSCLTWVVYEMLLKLNYATAAVGWMLTRFQAQAFSVVGFQKLSNPTHRGAAGFPSPTSTSPSTPRTSATAARRSPSSRLPPLHMSIGGDAVESSIGTTSEEQHSVLDALIDQFTSPKSGNVTATVEEYLDLCDHAFLTHLRRRIEAEEAQSPAVRA